MRFKFVVNHEDNTLRCLYDDRLIGLINNVGAIQSIKRISDIEPNKQGAWQIQYRVSPQRDLVEPLAFHTRADAIDHEHFIVEDYILEYPECKEFLGEAN